MEVFLSVGRIATAEQRLFLERLEAKLRTRGLEPRTIGRNTFASDEPLDRIIQVMQDCRGLLVLAFERTYVESGHEWVSGEDSPVSFTARRYATPWHHIEISLAKILKLPIFAIIERGICEEGLLEDKYGWYVLRTKLDPAVLDRDETVGLLDDWAQRTRSSKAAPPIADLTVGSIVSALRPAQLWSVLVAVAAIVAGSFTIGLKWTQGPFASKVNEATALVSNVSPPTERTIRDLLSRGSYVTLDSNGRLLPWTLTNQPCPTIAGGAGRSSCIATPRSVFARNVASNGHEEVACFVGQTDCEKYQDAAARQAQLSPCRAYSL